MSAWLAQRRRKLATFLHSIRFRLSMWFSLVLAVILLVFCAFVYFRQMQDTYNQAAARLAIRISELKLALSQSILNEYDLNGFELLGGANGSTFTLREGEVLILVNRSGKVTTFTGPVSETDAKALAIIAMRQAAANKTSIYQISGKESEDRFTYLFISAPLGYDNRPFGWVTLGQQLDPNGQLNRLLWTLAIAGTITLAAALAGGYWLADRALRPVKTITRTAQAISDSGLDRRLNLTAPDELGELGRTFDQMLDRLQAAFNRQRQFTADASHELRTPLTIIGLETNRALSGWRSPAEVRQALEVIQSENKFMARLVDELLTLARMDAGQVALNQEPLDLSDLALDVIERLAPLARQKNIRLETGDLPEMAIRGDRQTLLQMLSNLVDNAIKYSPEGNGQFVRVETGNRPGLQGPLAWVRVSDNGPGIAPEHIPHLFERFYRVDRARSHNPEKGDEEAVPGSGLGLSIAQWIAAVYGGKIEVMSEPGKGSIFEVQLPQASEEIKDPRKASFQ